HERLERGLIMGLYSVFLGIGHLLGGWLGGFFASWLAVDGLVLATLVCGVIAAFTIYRLWQDDRKLVPDGVEAQGAELA
ncbi:MAG: hypothetical protein HY329_22695, partial [Chloroflexi bacterium]|nr:hypothetical protein [Chloroflexota bacterium]